MAKLSLVLFLVFLVVAFAHAGNDHFFQYANVPGWNAYEFGYHRGNHNHFTSRFEKAHGWTFKTKVRWGDKNGWGESYWDYNHTDKGKKADHHKGWGHQGAAFSENVPAVSSPSNNQEEIAYPSQPNPQFHNQRYPPQVQNQQRMRRFPQQQRSFPQQNQPIYANNYYRQ